MRARRALLYMPGDDAHKIKKATGLDVDSICMDLEDGVALNQKDAARTQVRLALQGYEFGKSERLVRINPVNSPLFLDDLNTVVAGRPDGLVIPKIEFAEHVRRVSIRIGEQEQVHGIPVGSIYLIVIVETALGIVNLREIAGADRRLVALVFGAEDYAGSVGAVRSPGGEEVFFARSAVVAHAAAYGLQAIDMVFVDFKNPEGLVQEARQGMQMGYSGKQIIHPAQIEPVQQVFTPDKAAITAALRLTRAYAEHQQEGVGAFGLDGKMVDAPMIRAAEQVLDRARAAGMMPEGD
ncbi:MAG: HpcH/HpaI aldolase/citrate lyase family protein [Anaerolineales bacterium]